MTIDDAIATIIIMNKNVNRELLRKDKDYYAKIRQLLTSVKNEPAPVNNKPHLEQIIALNYKFD